MSEYILSFYTVLILVFGIVIGYNVGHNLGMYQGEKTGFAAGQQNTLDQIKTLLEKQKSSGVPI